MPGDNLTGEARINNRMDIPVRLYFEMESTGNEELMKELRLLIRNGNDVVYDGDLTGTIKPAELLKQYEPGDETLFTYELSVPAELDNEYAMNDFHTVWTFSAKEVPDNEYEFVKTGQAIPIGLLIFASLTVLSGVGYIYCRKREGAANEK